MVHRWSVFLKYHALGEPTVFLLWGSLAMLAANYVQTRTFDPGILLISLPFGILVGLVLLANNIRDMAFSWVRPCLWGF